MNPQPFFDYAREREAIRNRREVLGQEAPWTDDPVLHKFRFCNVYREDDRVTRWYAENVRERVSKSHILLATILFRWFNRQPAGEAIFTQKIGWSPNGADPETVWQSMFGYDWSPQEWTKQMSQAILEHCGKGPYVTGSYIIKTPDGYNKLDGVLQCFEWLVEGTTKNGKPADSWEVASKKMSSGEWGLEQSWEWLRLHKYMGDFMAYEVVTDLRHSILSDAIDIYTWANPGPGAMRGLNRLHGRDLNHSQPKHVFVCEMRDLQERAHHDSSWPHRRGHLVEMRDIEHTLCEFDKYERARLGQGKPRGVYPHDR